MRASARPRRALVSAVLAVTALVLTAGCAASSGDGASTSVRVAFIPNANHLPLLVADAQGFFEDEGLDVTLTPVQNLGSLAGAMGKQFDLGSSTIPDVILQQQKGLDLALATNLSRESSERQTVGVFVAADSPITSVDQLAGTRIAAATLGGNLHRSVLHWLVEGGVDVDGVTVTEVPFPNMADQLAAGRVDAVESLEPFRSQLIAAGAKELVDPLTELADPISFVSLMGTQEWIDANPDTLEAFNDALESAIDFIGTNEDDARDILAGATELPAEVVATVPLPDYATDIPDSEVTLWADALEKIGQLPASADVDPDQILPAD